MVKKILITGSHGFTGKELHSFLNLKEDCELFLSDINDSFESNYHSCNLTDAVAVYRMIRIIQPEQIYHLAGAFSNSFDADFQCNVLITRNILESVLKLNPKTRVLLVGSSAEYGLVKDVESPIKETHALNPGSIYGLTKIYQTYLMKLYVEVFDLDIVMARTFNLYGKGMSSRLFIGKLYEQIDDLKSKNIDHISLGNIENKRDYISIKIAIKDYVRIMENGKKGEVYNIGSGLPTKVSHIMKKILNEENVNVDKVKLNCSVDKKGRDVKIIYANINKIKNLKIK